MARNLLALGAEMLDRVRRDNLSSPVLYGRGADSVTLAAAVGKTPWNLVDPGTGMVTQVESRDFIFSAADLILAGSLTQPARGDRITVGNDVYELLPFGGEPCWRYGDHGNNMIRVHTKRVGDA